MKIGGNAAVLDHIVVVAETLEAGAAYCENLLGIRPQPGGEHEAMGTHNCLLNLGDNIYLELIAINPAAAPSGHARWFGMDGTAQRERLVRSGPYLATFVANCQNIGDASLSLPELGLVHSMRRGSLNWLITIADDGALIENGAVPALIQWPHGSHPTRNMPEPVCRLVRLEAGHPDPGKLRGLWKKIGLEESDRLRVHAIDKDQEPTLVAHIDTPHGVKHLR